MITKQLRRFSGIFWALLLGTSLTLAFAPFEIFPLAIIAPAGLLVLLANKSPKQAFWLGLSFGFGLFCSGIYWIYHSMHFMGDLPSPAAAFITAALSLFMGLFPATACYFTNRYFPATNTAKTVYAFPAIWVLVEWVRSWLFTGFPWLTLGYSQTNSPLKGFAPLFSVYGVSIFVLMSSGLLIQAVLTWKRKDYRNTYLSLLACSAIWIAGGALDLIKWTSPAGEPMTVSLVQGNIPQSLKWSPEHLQLSLDTYEDLTEPLWKKNNLIIWPESAVPLTLQEAEYFINRLDEKAQKAHAHLILGLPIEGPHGYYNAVVTLGETENGSPRPFYLKRRLVPFGEYTPLQKYLDPLLNFLQIPTSNLIQGKENQAPIEINHVSFITSICFEVAFPELVNPRKDGSGVLLTVTNDAWFGESTAQAQHLQMAKMRSIELGRPSIFVGNDGITAIISPKGNVEAAAPMHEAAVLNGSVQPMTGTTPWMIFGYNPILAFIIVLLLSARRLKVKLTEFVKIQEPEFPL
ncbi:MAG: apolipoprotein N-acyltransferase [Gammaproteobacteria bacterium]